MRATKRVGHGGASGVVRGNTLESFDTALDIGVDMIEFDVRAACGRLVLAHTVFHARRPCVSLDEALAHLAAPRFRDVELNVDVKHTGAEVQLLDALRRHDLASRTLVSSQVPAVIDRVRRLAPVVRTGISVGGRVSRRSQHWGDWRGRVLAALRRGRFDALMAHHGLIDEALVDDVLGCGRELYAWTVSERPTIGRLSGLGVTGITTPDPRLFM